MARARRAVLAWPDARGWLDCAGLALVAGRAILLVGWRTGLLVWDLWDGSWLLLLLRVLAVPSLLEELLFRGALTPERGAQPRFRRAAAPGLLAFAVWHVVAGFVVPGAEMFLRLDFLLCATLLGLACAWMRWRTGSLWPGVAFHGVAVWTWLICLGGPEPI